MTVVSMLSGLLNVQTTLAVFIAKCFNKMLRKPPLFEAQRVSHLLKSYELAS